MEVIKAVYIYRKTKIKSRVLHYCVQQCETAEMQGLNLGLCRIGTKPRTRYTKRGSLYIIEDFWVNRLCDFSLLEKTPDEKSGERFGFRAIKKTSPQFADIYKATKNKTLLAVGNNPDRPLDECDWVGLFVLSGSENNWFCKDGIFTKEPDITSPLFCDLLDLISENKYHSILPQSIKTKIRFDIKTFLQEERKTKMQKNVTKTAT